MKKKNRTAPRGKKAGRIVKRIFAAILAATVTVAAVTTLATVFTLNSNLKKARSFPSAGCAQLELENPESGVWRIYSDGLKVMQLTDIHLGGGWMSPKKDAMALNAVAAMITAEKPDLVIATGDLAYPVPFQAGTFNNKSSAKLFAELMESLGVYWTMAYGNHDTEIYSYYSREDITEFYSSGKYPHCLMQEGPADVDGSGNQVFNIVNGDGVITRSLFIIDSHSYVDGDIFGIKWIYDNIHENQIEWYKSTLESIEAERADAVAKLSGFSVLPDEYALAPVKSSVFLHIPLEEYRDAWGEYIDNGFADTENVTYNYGTAGESGKVVYSGVHSDNFFETMLECGSTDSVFCGHDHLNGFSLNYKGINLTYGKSIDYLAYIGISKLGTQRGCTVIEYSPDGEIAFRAESYYQDKYTPVFPKEDVTMQEIIPQTSLETE